MEFWNDAATDESWEVLLELRKKADFVLIGGWACYLFTGTTKSKDIDIVVDYDTLYALKKEYAVKNTPFLKKYEMNMRGVSIDIYLPHYSRLAVPVHEITKHTRVVEGFRVPEPEILLFLKQGAEIDRAASAKGQKDRVDMLSLLINAGIDFRKYTRLSGELGLAGYPARLKHVVASAKREFKYLGISNLRKASLIKKDLTGKLSAA